MNEKKLTLAIISDLHSHPKNEGNDTYLYTDMLRIPILEHPVESFNKLVDEEKLEADLTICPGDFTNKSNLQGLISGWNYSLELHYKLKSEKIIATIGNHDIDSYGIGETGYSFENAKSIKQGFPIKDETLSNIFWSKGAVFVEGDFYRILVINSSYYHHSKEKSEEGKIGSEAVDYIKDYFNKRKDDDFINIALSHHSPIEHSRFDSNDLKDHIVNADELLKVLGEYKFDLYIHGHKHDPLLRYHECENSYKLPVLSSGSFSATTNLGFTGQKNTFHYIEIIKDKGKSNGKIKTWTFIHKNGWRIINDESGFHPYTGFGFEGNLEDLANKIVNEVGSVIIKKWSEILSVIPEINYLIPKETEKLDELLRDKYYLITDNKISFKPTIISNTKNI